MFELTRDMAEFIRLLENQRVKYVIVGGFAVNHYGYVRTTQDVDVLIVPTKANARRFMAVLSDFGFGEAGIPADAFAQEGVAVHLGVEPNRIDLLTTLKGVAPSDAYRRRIRVEYGGVGMNLIAFNDLIECKRTSDRHKDLADVEALREISAVKVKREPMPSGKSAKKNR